MEVRLVAAVVAQGGTVRATDRGLVCRMPNGAALPGELAAAIRANRDGILGALGMADWEETVRHIVDMTDDARNAYRAALAHDLAAWAEAEARLADRERGGVGR